MSFAAVVERLRKVENPYPGLRPFETEESHLFFGRNQQVADLVGRLERNRFVAVLGVSGSGKSSLVRAGLIPALARGRIFEAGRRWRMVITRPAGVPFESLAADLAGAGLDAGGLTASSHGLIEIARQLPPDESLLVIVDQFEELFRYKDVADIGARSRRRRDAAAAEAAEFVQLLLAASRHQPPVYIVLTMRSDYLGDCAEFRDLPETLNDCQYLVPRMTREQRREAIEGPLGRVAIAPALVQRLLNDAGDEPDQLPVLQHALMRTWNHWHAADPAGTRRIELADYDAIGGLQKALDQHANELLAGVSADLTAAIFKRLTAKGRSSRERRNPARLAELWAVCGADTPEQQAAVTGVVDHFRRGEATFLVPRDGALTGDTYVDITHESLIRQWRKLRDEWLPEEQAAAKRFIDLAARAASWSEHRGELLRGLDLDDALEWDRRRNPTAAWAQHYAEETELARVREFIRVSEERRREDLARQRRERRRLRTAIVVAIVAVVGGLSAIGVDQYIAARNARIEAFQARILSVPSVRDPLVRALLLSELADHASRPEDLAIYQAAAAAAIPFAVLRHPDHELVVGAGFVGGDRVAAVMQNGSLWSWRSDGRGDPLVDRIVEDVDPAADDKTSSLPSIGVAAFSRDGRWLAAGFASGAVWVGRTDRSNGAHVVRAADALRAGNSIAPMVASLAFSPDGRQLAAGYNDNRIRIWRLDSTDGILPASDPLVSSHTGPIATLHFDSAGDRLLTGSYDGTTRIRSLAARGERDRILGVRDDSVSRAAVSPDAAWVLVGYDNGVVRIRGAKNETDDAPAALRHAGPITAVAFARDGSTILTASADRTARIWTVRPAVTSDLSAGAGGAKADRQPRGLRTIGSPLVLAHDAPVMEAAFSEDGKSVISASRDGTIRLWRSDQGEPRIVGRHDGRVESVAFSPDGRQVVSASDDHTARIWKADGTGQAEVLAGHNDWVRSAGYALPDGRKLLSASDDGTLRLWDLTAPGKSKLSQEGSGVFNAAFDREGARVVTAVRDNTARIWKIATLLLGDRPLENPDQSEVVELHHPDWVLNAAFSPDGSRVVTACRDGVVRLWSPERSSRDPVKQFRHPHRTVVFSAAFSPDGSRIVTAAGDGVARVWSVSGSESSVDLRHTQEVNEAAFSPSGAMVVTASNDRTARLWSDGSERLVLPHGSEVRAAAFDQTEGRVVTGTSDGVVRVWRVTLAGLKDYLSQVSTACITPTMRVEFLGESAGHARAQYEACERGYGRTPSSFAAVGSGSTGAGHSPH